MHNVCPPLRPAPAGWVARNRLEGSPVVEQYSYALMRAVSKIIGQNVDYDGIRQKGETWYIIVSVVVAGFFFAVMMGEQRPLS